MLTFFVPGKPVPKGSMKAFMRRNMRFPVVTNDNPKSKPWASLVSLVAADEARKQGWPVGTGPVNVLLSFCMPRPAGHYGSGAHKAILRPSAPGLPAVKPDLDKLTRLVLDALTGIVWRDDGQVCSLTAHKQYADAPGVMVTVEEV